MLIVYLASSFGKGMLDSMREMLIKIEGGKDTGIINNNRNGASLTTKYKKAPNSKPGHIEWEEAFDKAKDIVEDDKPQHPGQGSSTEKRKLISASALILSEKVSSLLLTTSPRIPAKKLSKQIGTPGIVGQHIRLTQYIY